MKKRSRIALLTALLTIVFAAGIGVYSNYIGMQIYQESSNHLLESYAQISKTFTLFVQRNWTVLSQWDSLMSNVQTDEDVDEIWNTIQDNRSSWHYSDFYMVNQNSQYLTADGRKGSADSIDGVFQEMYSKGGPIVSTYTATYGVPKIAFAMPMSRNLTLDGRDLHRYRGSAMIRTWSMIWLTAVCTADRATAMWCARTATSCWSLNRRPSCARE